MPSAVEDKLHIRELKHEYCYATDDLDIEGIPEVFAEGAHLEVPIHDPLDGRDGIREYFEWFGEQEFEVRSHNVVNPLVDVDGDEATGKWYYMVVYTLPDGDLLFGHGEYDDEFVRTDDGWRLSSCIARRRITRRLPAERMD